MVGREGPIIQKHLMKSKLSTVGIQMVTAVTAKMLNSALKENLYCSEGAYSLYSICAYDENDKIYYFRVTPNLTEDDYKKMPAFFPEEIKKKGKGLFSELEKLKLFEIPPEISERTAEQKAAAKKAYDEYNVETAIFIRSGIPFELDTASFKNYKPITLEPATDPANSRAVYTQMFKECRILELKETRQRLICNVTWQPQSTPWAYSFDVKVCYKNADYDSLTSEEKDTIKSRFAISSDEEAANMFEISTLMVDLNTLSAKNIPTIIGIDEKTGITLIAAIENYIKATQEEALKLCHTIRPSPRNNHNFIFRPTNYTFTISGHSSGNSELYSLNYLTSFNGQEPVIKALNWDWLTTGEVASGVGGVMAFNRDTFFEKFNEYFRQEILSDLRKEVTATMESGVCSLKYCYSYGSDTSKDETQFKYSNEKKTFVWDGYSSSSGSEKVICWIPPIFAASGELKLKYTVNCASKPGILEISNVKYPAIIFETDVVMWSDVIYDDGHSDGNIVNKRITASIGFSVDQQGNFDILKDVKTLDLGASINKSGWSEFASFGEIDGCIDGIDKDISGWVNATVNNIENSFLNNFLGNTNWILPGNKTFAFRNEAFSDDQDFCSEITYTAQNN